MSNPQAVIKLSDAVYACDIVDDPEHSAVAYGPALVIEFKTDQELAEAVRRGWVQFVDKFEGE